MTLPKTEFLENAHIQTICTRVQYAAHNCPAKSIYGYAKAWSPLLDQPQQGPVYRAARKGLFGQQHRAPLVSLQTESYGARMQTMRESWTDERLDDLNGRVSDGFIRVDQRFDRVEADLRELRTETTAELSTVRGEIRAGFDRMDERFERVDARFESLHRLMLQLGGAMLTALIGLIATQL